MVHGVAESQTQLKQLSVHAEPSLVTRVCSGGRPVVLVVCPLPVLSSARSQGVLL